MHRGFREFYLIGFARGVFRLLERVFSVNPCKGGARYGKPAKSARNREFCRKKTGPEQGRNRKPRHRTSRSPLPAKDDVVVVVIGASLFDHPAKPHFFETFAYVPPQVMGPGFIAALLLRLQALVSD